MSITVHLVEEPQEVLAQAGDFLLAKPVLHNVILTLLEARIAAPEAGRYWIAKREGRVEGVVFQSPLTFPPTLTPMAADVAVAMVEAIAGAGCSLPGVNGEASTTATFAGHWAERCKVAAVPFQGMRLYERTALAVAIPGAEGHARVAGAADRDLLVPWVRAFQEEVEIPATDLDRRVDGWLAANFVWLWEHDGIKSMAVYTTAVGGVCRIMCVYTPPEFRRHGYAEACVYRLSEFLLGAGYRCALYTDLGNATSNSIYRRIGYRAVAEILRYRFG